jgi:hypothetical protein
MWRKVVGVWEFNSSEVQHFRRFKRFNVEFYFTIQYGYGCVI